MSAKHLFVVRASRITRDIKRDARFNEKKGSELIRSVGCPRIELELGNLEQSYSQNTSECGPDGAEKCPQRPPSLSPEAAAGVVPSGRWESHQNVAQPDGILMNSENRIARDSRDPARYADSQYF